MADATLSPTVVSAWLACEHTLTLERAVAAGRLEPSNAGRGSFAELVRQKGLEHEAASHADLRAAGLDVVDVPAKESDETFPDWVARVTPLLAQGHDVLFQFPLLHDGLRGVADFLVRVERPSTLGTFSYEPVDAKLARAGAAPGHVLQLCFYAEALAALQGVEPQHVHLELGSGERHSIVLATVDAYWRRVRARVRAALLAPTSPTTVARPCDHCDLCAFRDHCANEWRANDAVVLVGGVTSRDALKLEAAGVATLAALAELPAERTVAGLRAERLAAMRAQAALQRRADPDGVPPVEVVPPRVTADPAELERGRLPLPDDGDVFLDLEGHPIWTPARGLVFLFGVLQRGDDGAWEYRAHWAHDADEERELVRRLVEELAERRARFPGMHAYHYHHTERSSLQRLAEELEVAQEELARLVALGVFVDVYDVVRRRVRVGAGDLSLKTVERVAGFARDEDIQAGAGAVVEYEDWRADHDPERLARIARYNEDDVRATLVVRDWLLDGPLRAETPRPTLATEPELTDLPDDALVAALRESEVPWHHLLADLLGYWRREFITAHTQQLVLLDQDDHDLLDQEDVVAGLEFLGIVSSSGKETHPRARFRFAPQELGRELREKGGEKGALTFTFRAGEGTSPILTADELDPESRELQLVWRDELVAADVRPSAVVQFSHVAASTKFTALVEFAARVVAGATLPEDAARIALLRRDLPRFRTGGGPTDGRFTSDVDALARFATELEDGVLAVQGPPGTGKTRTGAAMISALVGSSPRRTVGVTAFSHKAIDNLVRAAVALHPGLRVLQAVPKPGDVTDRLPSVEYVTNQQAVKRWDPAEFDVVAGTAWLHANPKLTAGVGPLDCLLIDEAGQLGLADAVVATGVARNAVLLGDPLQLSQVSQAVHPDASGASVLEHVLGEAQTMPPERGAFLDVTRRMHPTITAFLSERIYDGRLVAHTSCALQRVDGEAGIRWVRAEHRDRSTSSPEEAGLVRDLVAGLVGRTWTDTEASTRPFAAEDVMIVAPYNDHVAEVRRTLDQDPRTAGARVGTVDKFQGQEAPVVVFSMSASTGEDIPRGKDFLFSRNRLNVAVSRARALAYVICTEELLNARARDVDDMALIGTLCALVEAATGD